jgi:hypothetical protein
MAPKILATIVAAIVGYASMVVYADVRDQAVIATVLADFSQRSDTHPYDRDGVILIEPNTRKWDPAWLAILASNPGGECPIGRAFYSRLIERNPAERSVDDLFVASPKWRKKDSAEAHLAFSTPKTKDGGPVRTLVQLSAPAFSESGDAAFVTFEFEWSIHGATAEYLVTRSGDRWSVKCSKLRFAV